MSEGAAHDILVSMVIPAYNQQATIGALLRRTADVRAPGFQIEVIVVDDGSSDDTAQIVAGFGGVRLMRQENRGKGAAVQRGVDCTRGDFVLVQDADLEYDPRDYRPLFLTPQGQKNVAVYGSRPEGWCAVTACACRSWDAIPRRGSGPGECTSCSHSVLRSCSAV